MSFVDEDDVLTNTHDRVHVMGIDDGGDIELLGNALQQFVDDKRCLGVQTGVGLVTEEILRVQGNSSGDGHTFLHTA